MPHPIGVVQEERFMTANPASASVEPPKTTRGIAWHVTAMVLFGSMDAVSKHLTASLPVAEILWVRYAFFLVFGVVLALRLEGFRTFRTKAPVLQVVRGLALVAEIILFTYAFQYLQLAEAHVMAAMGPLIVTALAVPMLGERVGARRWGAVGAGFIGVLIILRPGLGVFQPIQIVPLIGAASFGLYLVLTRMAARHDSMGTSTFYTALVGFLILSTIAPLNWHPPTPVDWFWLLIASLLGLCAHVCVIRALSLTEASALQPFNYVVLVWATFLGFLVFDDLPDWVTVLGASVIVFSGLYAWHRERLRGRIGKTV
ncbi:MAG: DMT family transporter [Proteobacteria bacterium]|nr:DMT family transporter [Pseudomonadota bacterium]